MRTTVDLDDDTVRAIEHVKRARGIGLSEAINDLVRLGLLYQAPPKAFSQVTHPLGTRIDVSNIAEALDLLDGPASR